LPVFDDEDFDAMVGGTIVLVLVGFEFGPEIMSKCQSLCALSVTVSLAVWSCILPFCFDLIDSFECSKAATKLTHAVPFSR
jgi:hypothetical protein